MDVTRAWTDMRKIMDTELGAARDGQKGVTDAASEIKRQVDPLLEQG